MVQKPAYPAASSLLVCLQLWVWEGGVAWGWGGWGETHLEPAWGMDSKLDVRLRLAARMQSKWGWMEAS